MFARFRPMQPRCGAALAARRRPAAAPPLLLLLLLCIANSVTKI